MKNDLKYKGNLLLLIVVTDQVEHNYRPTEFQCDALGISESYDTDNQNFSGVS